MISFTVEPDLEEPFQFCLTEAEKVKWLSEQQFEKALVGSNFEPPRLVVSGIVFINYISRVHNIVAV